MLLIVVFIDRTSWVLRGLCFSSTCATGFNGGVGWGLPMDTQLSRPNLHLIHATTLEFKDRCEIIKHLLCDDSNLVNGPVGSRIKLNVGPRYGLRGDWRRRRGLHVTESGFPENWSLRGHLDPSGITSIFNWWMPMDPSWQVNTFI